MTEISVKHFEMYWAEVPVFIHCTTLEGYQRIHQVAALCRHMADLSQTLFSGLELFTSWHCGAVV